MFCTGLAYLGNAKAQACVAKAYETGLGVVEDLSEAYTWYALACESRIADAFAAQRVEETRDRVKTSAAVGLPSSDGRRTGRSGKCAEDEDRSVPGGDQKN